MPPAISALYVASIFGQMVATCALIEGASSKGRWDLWFGERPGGVVAGDYGFDPLKLLPKDKAAADKMRLKELKNGRLAMIAVLGELMAQKVSGMGTYEQLGSCLDFLGVELPF